MSVIYYDTALKNKLKAVFGNTFFAPTDEAFRECAKVNNGRVRLPLMSFYRPMGFTINYSRYNERAFRTGYFVKQVKDHPKGKVKVLKELPIRLQYQIDIWAATKSDCDRLTEEMIMFLLYKPYIEFVNPKVDLQKYSAETAGGQEDKLIRAALKLEETVQDNSDISTFEDRGRYYRNTLEISFEEPRLFSYADFEKFVDEIPITYYELDEGTKSFIEIEEDLITHDIEIEEEEGGE